ncbi:hypothetical protein E1B28_011625 [Marasmius oreades]|uniref:Uncharacterized protein n=1 Tax=Marasmius oreades TaxID=181124 RepID=A0A9P7UQ56_9AGAR|nr:uncharacterized protein E1B28_011625 [Marasmius oreades]KAG7090003.1 hypothetical protein E1B28_011625 [Marasmius oreades]
MPHSPMRQPVVDHPSFTGSPLKPKTNRYRVIGTGPSESKSLGAPLCEEFKLNSTVQPVKRPNRCIQIEEIDDDDTFKDLAMCRVGQYLPKQHDKVTEPSLGDGKTREAPSIYVILEKLKILNEILHPPRMMGPGYRHYSKGEMDPYVRAQIGLIQTLFKFYSDPNSRCFGLWHSSAHQAAISVRRCP